MADGFLTSLIALVAVSSVLPVLPSVQAYTAELTRADARRYMLTALFGANLVGLGFIVLTPYLFGALDLTVHDLQVAGGVILLVYATYDILFSRIRSSDRQLNAEDDLGPPIAPLGVPILMGPASLSTLLVLSEVHGKIPVFAAMAIVASVNAFVLALADFIMNILGEGTSRAVGKVMSLILATLGAGMLRAGVQAMF